MNNCSCVYVGPEEDGNEFLKEKMVVAKKDYKCGECHNHYYHGWKTTLHSRQEQEVIIDGPDKNVLGDFSSKDTDLTFTLDDVDLLVG
ncbi:hypothetical protein LCGC14_1814850, partial [marine sediment metagenome]